MRLDRIRTLFVLSAFVAGSSLAAGPVAAQTPYDGLWQVTFVTKTGSCEPQARYPVTVSDGKVTAAGAPISGTVGSGGAVRVSFSGAFANGQLGASAGSGKWNGASGGIPCSGRWEASRQ
jgi:hypothetical protein